MKNLLTKFCTTILSLSILSIIWSCSEDKTATDFITENEYLFVKDINHNIINELDPGLLEFVKNDLTQKERNDDVQKLLKTYNIETGKIFQNIVIPSNGNKKIAAAFTIVQDAHIQDAGWVYDIPLGNTVGTIAQTKRLEAFTLRLSDVSYNNDIQYEAYMQDIGWQGSKTAGTTAGIVAQSKRMEALRFNVSSSVATSVAYRAYQQDYGWLGWVGNGEIAGVTAVTKRLEGFQLTMLIY